MDTAHKAERFAALHVKGAPVLLYNVWDAGTAKAVAGAGAKAIATSSWAVAAAHGYADGEGIPLALVHEIVGRVVGAVDLPVTVDFEGGYSEDEAGLAANVARLLDLGVVGINFEDRVIGGEGVYAVERQAARIAAIRAAADKAGVRLVINARTDLFLGRGTPDPKDSVEAAIERGAAYAAAGASSFFIPGLTDAALIGGIVGAVSLPVNVMMIGGAPSVADLASLGVARISWGNRPYVEAMDALGAAAGQVLG